jgi:hypothetical protein
MPWRERLLLWTGPGLLAGITSGGVEHRPVADEEVQVLLFEPALRLNTGDVRDQRTVEQLQQI